MTPYYSRDGIVIYCGECSNVLATFDPQSFDLTVTSPPYDDLRIYNGYTFHFDPIARQLYRVTKKGGVVVWVVGDQTKDGSESGTSFRQALGFMELGFRLHDTMIWNKGGFTGVGSLLVRYAPVFEYMFIVSKGSPSTFYPIIDRQNKHNTGSFSKRKRETNGNIKDKGKFSKRREQGQRFNIWDISPHIQSGMGVHPAPFPEALARDHIISWSNAGDLVLDPMCGSGTTGKMAQQLGRRCVLIDTSEEYCAIARERLRQPSFWSLPIQAPQPVQLEAAL